MLVADLLRLSAALPPAISGGASPSAPVLFDFRYLRDPEGHERRVEADRQLAALDDAFREARMHCALSLHYSLTCSRGFRAHVEPSSQEFLGTVFSERICRHMVCALSVTAPQRRLCDNLSPHVACPDRRTRGRWRTCFGGWSASWSTTAS